MSDIGQEGAQPATYPIRSMTMKELPRDPELSLRDHFASQALTLGGEYFHNIEQAADSEAEHVAIIAYEIADAMLKERAK